MMEFEHWLVVSDIDGTLNSKMRTLPKRNETAVRRFIAGGGHFTLASGRNVDSLRRHYQRLSLRDPAVVLNGAGVFDYSSGQMLWQRTMDVWEQNFVARLLKRFPKIEAAVCFADHTYVVRSGVLSQGQLTLEQVNFLTCGLEGVPAQGWCKVIFWGLPSRIHQLEQSVCASGYHPGSVMKTSPVSFELLSQRSNKGAAVTALGEIIKIDPAHIAVIGDYYNDAAMLRSAGLPACAGQAPREIREMCRYVACHCNQGCVGDLLEQIMAGTFDE